MPSVVSSPTIIIIICIRVAISSVSQHSRNVSHLIGSTILCCIYEDITRGLARNCFHGRPSALLHECVTECVRVIFSHLIHCLAVHPYNIKTDRMSMSHGVHLSVHTFWENGTFQVDNLIKMLTARCDNAPYPLECPFLVKMRERRVRNSANLNPLARKFPQNAFRRLCALFITRWVMHAYTHTHTHTISRLSWLWSATTIERNVLNAVHRPVVVCHICVTLRSAVREIPCEHYWYGFTITPLYWWYYTQVICIIYLRFRPNATRTTIHKWSETG